MNREEKLSHVIAALKSTSVTAYKIAKETGISPVSIRKYINGITEPTNANLEMLWNYFNKKEDEEINQEIELIKKTNIVLSPVVSRYSYSEYVERCNDREYIDALPRVPVMISYEPRTNYIVFEAYGNSMNNGSSASILDGDRLVCREVKKESWDKFIFNDYNFVIVHPVHGILIKRIILRDSQRQVLYLHSLNSEYEDIEISLKEIIQVFSIMEVTRAVL